MATTKKAPAKKSNYKSNAQLSEELVNAKKQIEELTLNLERSKDFVSALERQLTNAKADTKFLRNELNAMICSLSENRSQIASSIVTFFSVYPKNSKVPEVLEQLCSNQNPYAESNLQITPLEVMTQLGVLREPDSPEQRLLTEIHEMADATFKFDAEKGKDSSNSEFRQRWGRLCHLMDWEECY